jgi:hypothetical protein
MPVARSATEVGPGDWVKIGQRWERILTNTAFGATPVPREWVVVTQQGRTFTMWEINAYAKDGDPEVPGDL